MTGSELLALAATGIGGLLLVAIAAVANREPSLPQKDSSFSSGPGRF
jgi:hypothetical protein